jgi:hypothetical protein
MKKNSHLTLEMLEGDIWPAPEFTSHVVTTCHELRKKQLCDFTIEDLRLMIGQSIGLKYLLPKAMEFIAENPFAEGDFYEGDLLLAVVKTSQNALPHDKSIEQDLIQACRTALQSVDPKLSKIDRAKIESFLANYDKP